MRVVGNVWWRAAGGRRPPTRPGGEEQGAALVEFALVVVLLLPLFLGIVEFGRAWYTLHVVQGAAREGARVCAVTFGAPEQRIATARQRVDLLLAESGLEGYRIEFPDPRAGGWGQGRPIRVVVRQPFQSVVGTFIPALRDAIDLRGTAVFNQELP